MYQEKIEQYFATHKDAMLKDIADWVRIPSVGDAPIGDAPYGKENVKALTAAIALAEAFGFQTTNYDNYVMAADFNDKPKSLDILAHLDVVPAPAKDWTITQPFEPVIQDGKIYGRGTADDKGPAVAALYAMKAVKDLGIPLQYNVRLILGTDEERGGSDLDYYYSKEKEAPMSFTPDASFPVINVEKGRLSTEIKAEFPADATLPRLVRIKGGHTVNVIPDEATAVLEGIVAKDIAPLVQKVEETTKISFSVTEKENLLTVSAKGTGGHAASPEDANNAVTGLVELLCQLPLATSEGFTKLKALGELFPHGDWTGKHAGVASYDDISGDTTISLNILTMDDTSLSSFFDGRCSLNATEENLNQVFQQVTKERGLVFVDKPLAPPHHVPCDSDFVKTLLKCYEQYSGEKGECLAIGGGTYVHNLENGVAFGAAMPDTNNNMHGADEFAVIEELVMSAKIFTQAIIELCGEDSKINL